MAGPAPLFDAWQVGFVATGIFGSGVIVKRLADGKWSAPASIATIGAPRRTPPHPATIRATLRTRATAHPTSLHPAHAATQPPTRAAHPRDL